MLDIIQALANKSEYGLNNFNNYNCDSNSKVFNMVIESMLKAMKENNKVLNNNKVETSIENLFNNINRLDINIDYLNSNEKIDYTIEKYSNKYGVDSKLIQSIIKVESNFDPNAISEAGAQGLMQLMPNVSQSLGITDPLDIEQNIEGGVRHIKSYIDRYNGDIQMALMAYNGGPTNMVNRGVVSIEDIYKMPKETQNYVPKVMNYYRSL